MSVSKENDIQRLAEKMNQSLMLRDLCNLKWKQMSCVTGSPLKPLVRTWFSPEKHIGFNLHVRRAHDNLGKVEFLLFWSSLTLLDT